VAFQKPGGGRCGAIAAAAVSNTSRKPVALIQRPHPTSAESVTMISSDYLAICAQHRGTTCVLRLRGDLDVCSRESLRTAISSVFNRCPQMLVLDLSGLEFIDCGGLWVLIWARNAMAASCGQLLLTGCPLPVRRLIHLTGADQYLHLCPAPALHAACREVTRARQRIGIACWSRDAFRPADLSPPDPA